MASLSASIMFFWGSSMLKLVSAHYSFLLGTTWWTWVVSAFWLFGIMHLAFMWNRRVNSFHFSWVEIAGSYGNFMLNFLRIWQTFSKWLCHFAFPPACLRVPISLHPCQHLLSVLLITATLMWCLNCVSHCVFLFGISLMTDDSEHLCVWLLTFHVSSLYIQSGYKSFT